MKKTFALILTICLLLPFFALVEEHPTNEKLVMDVLIEALESMIRSTSPYKSYSWMATVNYEYEYVTSKSGGETSLICIPIDGLVITLLLKPDVTGMLSHYGITINTISPLIGDDLFTFLPSLYINMCSSGSSMGSIFDAVISTLDNAKFDELMRAYFGRCTYGDYTIDASIYKDNGKKGNLRMKMITVRLSTFID